MKRTISAFVIFLLTLISLACQGQNNVSQTPATPSPEPVATVSATPATTPSDVSKELKTVASGLQYQDEVIGGGQKPGFNQKVRIAYVGKFQNGTTFGQGVDDFKLGVGEVIKGWDQGIAGGGGVEPMREGGKRKLIIPPALGYGDKIIGTIPPNTTLTFEIELLRTLGGGGFGK